MADIRTPVTQKLLLLWLAGFSPEEAFKLTNWGMSRSQQSQDLAMLMVRRAFATSDYLSEVYQEQVVHQLVACARMVQD